MSVRSFVQSGMHFGKLGERKSDAFGVIELYDIGEPDTVGAFYTGDRSFQAHSVVWYDDLKLRQKLEEFAKKRPSEEQQIVIVQRPRIGQKPSLAEDLRRLSHKDDVWVSPKASATEPNNDDAAAPPAGRTRQPRSSGSRTPRAPRGAEAVDIPKGADKQLTEWAEQHGACKAIRLLVHTYPTMNRVSVVALATQCKIHKTTAGVQYTNAKRDISVGRTEGAESKKAKGAVSKQKKAAKKTEPVLAPAPATAPVAPPAKKSAKPPAKPAAKPAKPAAKPAKPAVKPKKKAKAKAKK